ncbi:tat protein [Simian immunodeficiency virus]|uniref:Protein Tat n=1 Tax=Simian immunodeficiency virus TaxID=11723 RepID=A4UDF7_SIV|nr:tat protein [Simian immunodeficiency virus]
MDPSVEGLPPDQRPGAAPPTPCTNCYCKCCAFHCILCFQKKALGISYGRRIRKRPRTDSLLPSDQNPVRFQGRATLPSLHRSIPDSQQNKSNKKKQKKALEEAAGTDPCRCFQKTSTT